MDDIYTAWKPIRNFLRKTDPKTALEVLRYYSLFSGTPGVRPPAPPSYIEVHQGVMTREFIGILPWDIEVLAREVVYSSEEERQTYEHDLRQWRHFGNLMEKLRRLDNKISEVGIGQSNVLLEMFRIGHRQFPHQQDAMSKVTLVRYGRLFTHSEVAPIVVDNTGLPYEKIATIGVGFWGKFNDYAAISHPAQGFNGTNITQGDLEHFLGLYSKSFQEMKSLVNDSHVVDNTFLYQYSPLNAYPLVKFERDGETTYVCTSVNRFASQITRGVYYMLYSDSRFDNAFGNAFEDYVGEVLTSTAEGAGSYMVYSQETDPSSGKRRCDWILEQGDEFVMIECKTKRMAIGGYTVLDDDTVLVDQLGKIADAVVQTYQGYLVYKGDGYNPPVYPYTPRKKAAICVVTLEKWYLYGVPLEKLHQIVKEKLEEKGIDVAIIKEAPYEVMGVDDFEKLTYLASQGESVRDMFDAHAGGDEVSHEFSVFMNNNYKDKLENYDYVFGNDLDLYITPGQDGVDDRESN